MPEQRYKLLYDGQCPFCRREVEWLRRRDRDGNLALEDIADPGFDPAQYGLTREEVMGVLHGVLPDGRVVRRVEAIRQAYRAVGLGWLVAPTRLPLVRWASIASMSRSPAIAFAWEGFSADSAKAESARRRNRQRIGIRQRQDRTDRARPIATRRTAVFSAVELPSAARTGDTSRLIPTGGSVHKATIPVGDLTMPFP